MHVARERRSVVLLRPLIEVVDRGASVGRRRPGASLGGPVEAWVRVLGVVVAAARQALVVQSARARVAEHLIGRADLAEFLGGLFGARVLVRVVDLSDGDVLVIHIFYCSVLTQDYHRFTD